MATITTDAQANQHTVVPGLPPRLFGSIAYYAYMRRFPTVAIDYDATYRKAEKDVHRFAIADTRGALRLTVPVSRAQISAGTTRRWADMVVSDHGRWYETLPTALESAYGRTPFFEFYIDRLRPIISEDAVGMPITDMCRRADSAVRRILALPTQICEHTAAQHFATDADMLGATDTARHYWQVRADVLGFIPNLSILDLIFNLGPEADLYLEAIALP